MRRERWSGTLIWLAVATLCPCVIRAQGPEIPLAVKTHVQQQIDRGYWTGVAIGLVDRNGTTFFSYGRTARQGGEAVNEHSVFEIGSITKTFTGLLLADFVVHGQLGLDDPIARYLPEEVKVPERADKQITLRDLSTHTSGLPRLPTNLSPADPANPYADYTVQQMYDFLSRHELRRDIGAQFEYSNYGVGLLGHVLARRTGTTYERLVVDRIAQPLGMSDTRVTLTDDMKARLAAGHSGSQQAKHWDIPTLAGAGVLRSTAADMTRYVAANLGLLPSPLDSALLLSHQEQASTDREDSAIGLGWIIRHGEASDVFWHNGGTGGYRSFVGFDKTTGLGVVVLSNNNESVDAIGSHLFDPSTPLAEVKDVVKVDAAILDRYVGKYELQPGFILTVTREGEQLMVQVTGQDKLPVYPSSATEFFYTIVDARITFEVEPEGSVNALMLHQNGNHRAERKNDE